MNSVVVAGNVGTDPDVREAGGKSVAKFTLATKEGKDKTTWHRIVAWEKLADQVSSYVSKGSFIVVHGRIQNGSYEKDGVKIPTSDIIASHITFGPRKETSSDDEAGF